MNPQENQQINQQEDHPKDIQEDRSKDTHEEHPKDVQEGHYKRVVEALLFVSPDPVSLKQLVEILELPQQEVVGIIDRLKLDYLEREGALQVIEIANGYQLATKEEFAPYIERLYKPQGGAGLSRAALETLAIIAYKEPITRAEMEQIRGVKVDKALQSLIEKELVAEIGRKEAPGRPAIFATTEKFLKHFGLKNLKELPELEQFVVLEKVEELEGKE